MIVFSSKILSDLLAAYSGLFLAYYIRFHYISYNIKYDFTPPFNQYFISFSILTFSWIVVFYLLGLYNVMKKYDAVDDIYDSAKGCFLGILFVLLPAFFYSKGSFSRLVLIIGTIFAYIFINIFRVLLHKIFQFSYKSGLWRRNCLIIGCDEKSFLLLEKLKSYPDLGHNVIGFICLDPNKYFNKINKNQILGSIKNIPQLIKEYKIEEIIIAPDNPTKEYVLKTISYCSGMQIDVFIVPSLYDIVLGSVKTNQIDGFPLIEIFPDILPSWQQKIKRTVDLTLSLFILILFFPIWLIIALLIKINSPGSVLYKQERIGKKFVPFTIYKFRSMIQDAEKHTGPVWAEKNDQRITKVGKILRKLRLDEFPQLLNVLKGDMSIVGPRPERKFFIDELKKEIPLYVNRLKVKPGITGWAQIKHKYDSSMDDVKEKVKYDLYYIENLSIKLDLKILLNTVLVMLFKGHKKAH